MILGYYFIVKRQKLLLIIHKIIQNSTFHAYVKSTGGKKTDGALNSTPFVFPLKWEIPIVELYMLLWRSFVYKIYMALWNCEIIWLLAADEDTPCAIIQIHWTLTYHYSITVSCRAVASLSPLDGQDGNISSIFPLYLYFLSFFLKFSQFSSSFWSSGWATRPPGKVLATPLVPWWRIRYCCMWVKIHNYFSYSYMKIRKKWYFSNKIA